MTVASIRQAPSQRDIEHLGEQIAELSAHIDAATYRLLVLIADFDQSEAAGTVASRAARIGSTGAPASISERHARRCEWPER